MIPPVAENDRQIRQTSFNSFSSSELKFSDVDPIDKLVESSRIKPRRRLGDTKADRADGLDILIQKTKAIALKPEEEELTSNENGNEWLDALNYKGEKLLWGVTKIRKYVCGIGSDAHAEELIEFNVIDRLLFFMDETTPENVLFEILWIITNIAAGPTAHTTALVEKEFILPLGKLLSHPKGNIRTQAAWAIGNIIGDREGYRDLVLEAGLLPFILNIWKGEGLEMSSKKESLRISLWIVDNMCRYKPDWQLMGPAFEIIPQVLQQDEPAILKECCWAVARILHQSGRNQAIDSMITPAFCSRLVEILRWDISLTTHPILRALINLASSKNVMHLKYIVEAGIIPLLDEFLVSNTSRTSFGVFAIQILGNLASTREFAGKIALHQSTCEWLLKHLCKEIRAENEELLHEVCITVRNMLFHNSETVSRALFYLGVVEALREYLLHLGMVENRSILACVEALDNALKSDACPKQVKDSTFNCLMNLFYHASGNNLDEFETNVEWSEEEIDSDQEDQDQKPPISFEFSNPTRNSSHQTSRIAMKEKKQLLRFSEIPQCAGLWKISAFLVDNLIIWGIFLIFSAICRPTKFEQLQMPEDRRGGDNKYNDRPSSRERDRDGNINYRRRKDYEYEERTRDGYSGGRNIGYERSKSRYSSFGESRRRGQSGFRDKNPVLDEFGRDVSHRRGSRSRSPSPPPRHKVAKHANDNNSHDSVQKPVETNSQSEIELDEEKQMRAMMGFAGFDTTKDKIIPGKDVGATDVKKKRGYKQVMNRVRT